MLLMIYLHRLDKLANFIQRCCAFFLFSEKFTF